MLFVFFCVERFKPILQRGPRALYQLAYAAAVAFFLWNVTQYYIPGQGFTCLIFFGGAPQVRRIRELQSIDYYVDKDSNGYDGQYYAQLAVKPLLTSRDLAGAMDNLPYRARRILFSGTAYLLGLGQPAWVLQAYALQNIAAWLLLAWLLLRWFPPTGPGNLVRWAGVLFAWGLTMSVREALMDGPSLLLIAFGVALFERGRRWTSTCVLGIAGLGRETNLLALPALAPGGDWHWREILRAAGRGLLALMPLAAWIACIWFVCGQPSNAGVGNIGRPFAAYFAKWFDAVRGYRAEGWDSSARWTLILLTSLSVQLLVILLRPRWSQPWWRVGAPFAVLFIFLGPAVWGGYPGAAARVVLPMTLAFNVLVPRGLRWWPILLLGNLSALSAVDQLRPPGIESYRLEGGRRVARPDAAGDHGRVRRRVVPAGKVPLRILALEPRPGHGSHPQSPAVSGGSESAFQPAVARPAHGPGGRGRDRPLDGAGRPERDGGGNSARPPDAWRQPVAIRVEQAVHRARGRRCPPRRL